MSAPLILIAHGSPDPDWRRPLVALRERVERLAAGRAVQLAYLDFLAPDLETVARELAEAGHRHAVVVAAFLSPGGRHLKRDIPELVARTQAAVPALQLTLAPGALGDDEAVIEALALAALRRASPDPE